MKIKKKTQTKNKLYILNLIYFTDSASNSITPQSITNHIYDQYSFIIHKTNLLVSYGDPLRGWFSTEEAEQQSQHNPGGGLLQQPH